MSTPNPIRVVLAEDQGMVLGALDAGARGYLLKDRPASELAEAVRRVHRGLRVIDPDLAAEA